MADPENSSHGIEAYHYSQSGPSHAHAYLLPSFLSIVERYTSHGSNVFEIGAGNGHIAGELARRGYLVTGIEPSSEGVDIAARHSSEAKISHGSIYDDLSLHYGKFDFVFALEVVEHLYAPRELPRQASKLLKNGGVLCVSTPFHGYWKNLSLALTGKLDQHFGPLWDHGHIKFWSLKNLSKLFQESGFQVCDIRFVGRMYPLSKSMILTGRKIA